MGKFIASEQAFKDHIIYRMNVVLEGAGVYNPSFSPEKHFKAVEGVFTTFHLDNGCYIGKPEQDGKIRTEERHLAHAGRYLARRSIEELLAKYPSDKAVGRWKAFLHHLKYEI